MLDAMDVARHLIRIGSGTTDPAEAILICPLRLQKLLYYCQGWALALLDRPLFPQSLEAWPKGPVVPEVYREFPATHDPITPARAGEPVGRLTQTEAALVEMVWKEYACHPPQRLIEMTHSEPAWREARGSLGENEPSSAPLSHQTMAEYFREVARKRAEHAGRPGFPVVDPIRVWQAEEEIERTGGAGASAEDVFGPLLSSPAD